jgi:hypothetical protein
MKSPHRKWLFEVSRTAEVCVGRRISMRRRIEPLSWVHVHHRAGIERICGIPHPKDKGLWRADWDQVSPVMINVPTMLDLVSQ